MQPLRIYIAAPYTQGDPAINVGTALQAADDLVAKGHIPFIPHISHFWHIYTPRPYQFWIRYTLHWLAQCDALVRLPGESPGADQEVAWALEHKLMVFEGLDEVPDAD